MIEEIYNFTYTIENVNIEIGTFVINYIPESEYLTPISLNTYLVEKELSETFGEDGTSPYASQEDIPFEEHVRNTVDRVAPISQWRNQYRFQNNLDTLLSANGRMEMNYSYTPLSYAGPPPI